MNTNYKFYIDFRISYLLKNVVVQHLNQLFGKNKKNKNKKVLAYPIRKF